MILNRLLVRERLAIIVAVPLLALVALAVPFVADRAADVRAANRTLAHARITTLAGGLVRELQRERLISARYLVTAGLARTALLTQVRLSMDRASEFGTAAADGPRVLTEAIAGLARLGPVRTAVLDRKTGIPSMLGSYRTAIDAILGAVEQSTPKDGGDPDGVAGIAALQALMRADEATSRIGSALVAYAGDGYPTAGAAITEASAHNGFYTTVFRQNAPADEIRLVDQVILGKVGRGVQNLAARAMTAQPVTGIAGAQSADDVARAAGSQAGLRLLVQEQVARRLASAAATRAKTARTAATAAVGLILLALAGLVLLSIRITRSITRPLGRLTTAAGAVADFAQTELLRVTDESDEEQPPPRLAAIDVAATDELGDLAAAFNRVQATASLLVERQIETRRNVAEMFSSVAHRTQNLVSRQLSLIDSLERNERDPAVLSQLYRLDQVCTRLRRSANSLLVVSGMPGELQSSRPVALSAVLRTALSEVEEYSRFRLGRVPDAAIAGAAAVDIALLFAELCDNAAQFSPPATRIEIDVFDALDSGPPGSGRPFPDPRATAPGYVARVTDHGMGLPAERLAEQNHRLTAPENIEATPTRMLGLFVAARLARRHGLSVQLGSTPGGGVTAYVSLPAAVLAAPDAEPRSPERAGDAMPDRGPLTAAGAGQPIGTDGARHPWSGPGGWPDFDWFTGDAGPAAEDPHSGGAARTEIRGDLTRRVRGAQLPPGSAGSPYLAATPPARGHAARDRLPGAPDPHSHQRDPAAARTAMQAFQRVPRHLDLSDLADDAGRVAAPIDTSRPAAAETRSGLPRRVRGQNLARDLREPRPDRAPREGYRQRDADAEREQLGAFATASRRGAAATPADHERTSSP